MPRKPGSKKFSQPEVDLMLTCIQNELPLGSDAWDEVCSQYNILAARKGFCERDVESIKRKFRSGYTVKKPTGDPSLPAWVQRAKLIQKEINGKAHVQTLGRDDDEQSDEESEDEDFAEEGEKAEKESSSEDPTSDDDEHKDVNETKPKSDAAAKSKTKKPEKNEKPSKYESHVILPRAAKRRKRIDDVIGDLAESLKNPVDVPKVPQTESTNSMVSILTQQLFQVQRDIQELKGYIMKLRNLVQSPSNLSNTGNFPLPSFPSMSGNNHTFHNKYSFN